MVSNKKPITFLFLYLSTVIYFKRSLSLFPLGGIVMFGFTIQLLTFSWKQLGKGDYFQIGPILTLTEISKNIKYQGEIQGINQLII